MSPIVLLFEIEFSGPVKMRRTSAYCLVVQAVITWQSWQAPKISFAEQLASAFHTTAYLSLNYKICSNNLRRKHCTIVRSKLLFVITNQSRGQ